MELIGIVKASIILNMHQVTLREKAAKDEIPGYKIGGRWKFDAVELEKFVKKDKDRSGQVAGHEENICHVKSSPQEKRGNLALLVHIAEW